jgi:hypothetical protein
MSRDLFHCIFCLNNPSGSYRCKRFGHSRCHLGWYAPTDQILRYVLCGYFHATKRLIDDLRQNSSLFGDAEQFASSEFEYLA